MNAHRVKRATTALPECPSCKQSATGIYNKKRGCNRCGRLAETPASIATRVDTTTAPAPEVARNTTSAFVTANA